MGWIETALIIVIVFLYIMTFFNAPALTMEFTKEYVKSGGKMVIKIKDVIKDFKTEDKGVIENDI